MSLAPIPTPKPAVGEYSFVSVPVPHALQCEIEEWWVEQAEAIKTICDRHGVSVFDVRLPTLERLCYVLEYDVPKPHDSERSTD